MLYFQYFKMFVAMMLPYFTIHVYNNVMVMCPIVYGDFVALQLALEIIM